MTVRKTHVIVAGSDGVHVNQWMDTIEHEGGFWLVPEWLENEAIGLRKPQRIIALTGLEYQRTPGADPEFVVSMPIPISVFEGRVRSGTRSKYTVVEAPEIVLPLDPSTH